MSDRSASPSGRFWLFPLTISSLSTRLPPDTANGRARRLSVVASKKCSRSGAMVRERLSPIPISGDSDAVRLRTGGPGETGGRWAICGQTLLCVRSGYQMTHAVLAYHAIPRLEFLPSLGSDQDLIFGAIVSVHHGAIDQNDMRIAQPLKL